MAVQQPQVILALLVGDLVANYFAATDKIKLYSNDIEIEATTVLADLTELTATGYAEQTIAEDWVAGIDPDSGLGIIKYPLAVTWPAVSADPPVTAFGWYVVDTTEAILKAVGTFAEPIPLIPTDTWVSVLVWLLLDANSDQHQEEIGV